MCTCVYVCVCALDVSGHKEVVDILECLFLQVARLCVCARGKLGSFPCQLCEVMCLERWWRSLKDSLQMGHLSFSSRLRFTKGSMAYSFL